MFTQKRHILFKPEQSKIDLFTHVLMKMGTLGRYMTMAEMFV